MSISQAGPRFIRAILPHWAPPTPGEIAAGDRLPPGFSRSQIDRACGRLVRFADATSHSLEDCLVLFQVKKPNCTIATTIWRSNIPHYIDHLEQDRDLFKSLQKAGALFLAVPPQTALEHPPPRVSPYSFRDDQTELRYRGLAGYMTEGKVGLEDAVRLCNRALVELETAGKADQVCSLFQSMALSPG